MITGQTVLAGVKPMISMTFDMKSVLLGERQASKGGGYAGGHWKSKRSGRAIMCLPLLICVVAARVKQLRLLILSLNGAASYARWHWAAGSEMAQPSVSCATSLQLVRDVKASELQQ